MSYIERRDIHIDKGGGVGLVSVVRQCAKAGCYTLVPVTQRYCAKHQGTYNKQYNQQREQNHHDYIKFYHSKAWKQARQPQLTREPLCEVCLGNGLVSVANTVHHIDDVKEHWNERLNEDNLQSVCKSCHEKIYKGRWSH